MSAQDVSAREVEQTVAVAVSASCCWHCRAIWRASCSRAIRSCIAPIRDAARERVASLVGLALGIALHVSMPALYVMSLGLHHACQSGIMLLFVLWQKPWLLPRLSCVDLSLDKELLDSGSSFFLIQVAAVVVFSSDNLIVSHYLGASEVTPYSVTWRFAGLAAVLQSLIFPGALAGLCRSLCASTRFQWIRTDVRHHDEGDSGA